MGATSIGWFRVENGTVMEMDLPLAEVYSARVSRGEIVRVANAQGDPYEGASVELTPVSGEAAELVEARERVAELTAELDLATKQIEQLRGQLAERDQALAEPPAQSAAKSEWVRYAVQVHGTSPDDAEAMTKVDLIDKYSPKG